MRKKTSRYILLFLIISNVLFLHTSMLYSQNPEPVVKEVKKKIGFDNKEKIPFYQGLSVGVNIADLGSHVLGSDKLSTDIMVQANLLNRFLPTVELGLGKVETISDETNIRYKTSAPFFKIGGDYNFYYKKPEQPGYLFLGFRYAFSSFSYDVEGPSMTDPNYGGQIEVPFSYTGISSNAHWLEFVGGLKVKIYKGFCMGWSLRYKKLFNVKKSENSEPWYIPGYGNNSSTNFSFSYHLIYNLPF